MCSSLSFSSMLYHFVCFVAFEFIYLCYDFINYLYYQRINPEIYFKWSSVIGFLIGVCIAFFVVIGDLGPPLAAEFLNIEVKYVYIYIFFLLNFSSNMSGIYIFFCDTLSWDFFWRVCECVRSSASGETSLNHLSLKK